MGFGRCLRKRVMKSYRDDSDTATPELPTKTALAIVESLLSCECGKGILLFTVNRVGVARAIDDCLAAERAEHAAEVQRLRKQVSLFHDATIVLRNSMCSFHGSNKDARRLIDEAVALIEPTDAADDRPKTGGATSESS